MGLFGQRRETAARSRPHLYHNDLSTCAQKIRLALAEKDIPWESHHLDLRAGDQRKEEFLALNPRGVVPVLIQDDDVIVESTIILEYLEDAYPSPSLRPDDPGECAAMRLWMKRLDDKMHAMTGVLSMCVAFRHEYLAKGEKLDTWLAGVKDPMERDMRRAMIEQGTDFPAVPMAMALFAGVIAEMEAALQETTFLASDSYSCAEAAWTPYMNRLEHLRLEPLWDRAPKVSAWWGSLKARPSFKTALTDVEKPDRVALMREKGAEECGKLLSFVQG